MALLNNPGMLHTRCKILWQTRLVTSWTAKLILCFIFFALYSHHTEATEVNPSIMLTLGKYAHLNAKIDSLPSLKNLGSTPLFSTQNSATGATKPSTDSVDSALTNSNSSPHKVPSIADSPPLFFSITVPLMVGFLVMLILLLFVLQTKKRSQRELQKSERNYRELFNFSSEAIVIRDMETGKLIDVNHRFTELYGFAAEDVAALNIKNTSSDVAPYTEAEAVYWLAKAINEGPQLFEWHAKHADGHLFWVEVSLHIEELEGKQRSVASARDITERKLAVARANAIEQQMQRTYKNLPIALFTIDKNHKVTQWNTLLEQMTNTNANEIVGSDHTWRGFYLEPRPCLADFVLNNATMDEIQTHYKNPVLHSKVVIGGIETEAFLKLIDVVGDTGKWLQFTAVPLLDEDGQMIGALETLTDMTERKLAEIALRNSEATYRTLIDHAPEAMLVLDADKNRFIDVNRNALQLFRYQHADLLKLSPIKLVSTKDNDGKDLTSTIVGYFNESLIGPDLRFELKCVRSDGTKFPCELHLVRLPSPQNTRLIRCNITDITERKAAEEAILKERNFLEALLDAMPIPIFYKNKDGIYLGCNDAFITMTGLTREKIINKKMTDWLEPNRVKLYEEKDQELYQKYEKQVFQLHLDDYFNEVKHVIFHRAVYKNQFGIVDGMIGAILDITELEKTKIALEQLNLALESRVLERTEELQQAMKHLIQSEKLAALGNLVAGIAHELNTPIGNIVTIASTLKDETSSFLDKLNGGGLRKSEAIQSATLMHEAGKMIEHNAIRSAKLISDFKQVAVDQSSARRRSFDLESTVQEVMTTLLPMLKRTSHVVEIDIPEKIQLDSYPGPIEQIITNLTSNSLLHGFEHIEKGHISIKAQLLNEEIILDYQDNGHGMTAETQVHLFDPFFTTKLGQGGSGLGLYIVYNLVTGVLGGRISIHSSLDTGAHFTLCLPQKAP
ncbi:PAS domain S-box-containing protein [Undibacterium sp. GrIS 1.8]